MGDFVLDKPVGLFIFNRPETTARVLDAIRRVKPPTLLVIADGPRPDRPGDADGVAASRSLIEDSIDWDCRVLKNYADSNLGLRDRQSSGFDWVFETVPEAILLEDDTLPDPTFFPYCQELLNRYRDDTRIMHISGTNFYYGRRFGPASYFFSRYVVPAWGWATWRRAWELYDAKLGTYPEFEEQRQERNAYRHRLQRFQNRRLYAQIHDGGATSWDYQWQYAVATNNGLAIHPNVNLVANLGIGSGEATHTDYPNPTVAANRAAAIQLPLVHPGFVVEDRAAERVFYRRNILQRNVSFLVQWLLPRPLSGVLRKLYRLFGGTSGIGEG